MIDRHQIATDDGQSADLAASVAESREAALLRELAQSFTNLAQAADVGAGKAVHREERRVMEAIAETYRFAVNFVDVASMHLEPPVVSPYGKG